MKACGDPYGSWAELPCVKVLSQQENAPHTHIYISISWSHSDNLVFLLQALLYGMIIPNYC